MYPSLPMNQAPLETKGPHAIQDADPEALTRCAKSDDRRPLHSCHHPGAAIDKPH
jgi:hypothetical protein